ncbi:hypothetical protein HYX70_01320 [Candidatus Saccharibacteria bacterium]|nr:hypothetical protein [Candidatus Saccharibacteria bacterium]
MPDPWTQELWLQRRRYSVKYRIVEALMLRGYDVFELEAMLVGAEDLVYEVAPIHHDRIRYLDARLNEIHEALVAYRCQYGLFSDAELEDRMEG